MRSLCAFSALWQLIIITFMQYVSKSSMSARYNDTLHCKAASILQVCWLSAAARAVVNCCNATEDNTMLFANYVAALEYYCKEPSRFKETDQSRHRRVGVIKTWLKQTIQDVLSQVRLLAGVTSMLCPAC